MCLFAMCGGGVTGMHRNAVLPRILKVPTRKLPGGGGGVCTGFLRGGGMQAGMSAFQILYKNFVRNLFCVFRDLCR